MNPFATSRSSPRSFIRDTLIAVKLVSSVFIRLIARRWMFAVNSRLVLPRVATLGVLLAIALSPTLHAQRVLFEYGTTTRDSVAEGSYVHWSNFWWNQENGLIGYQRLSQITVGQQWEYDGGVDGRGYDLYRGFVVFDLPRFTGVVTREEVGIPDGVRPEITTLLTRVTAARLSFNGFTYAPHSDAELPIETRWTTLSAAGLADGSIDPATAYAGLTTGHLVDVSEFNLGGSFVNFLNHSDGGPVVFSFTMPTFIDRHTFSSLGNLDPGLSLTIDYAGYEAMAPVPEPATYAVGGILLCALVTVGRRRFRAKTAPSSQTA